jgi:hypothetical protein
MNTLIGAGIGIAVACIVVGAVAIPILKNVSTAGWSGTDITIYTYIPTFLLLALLVGAVGAGMYYMK